MSNADINFQARNLQWRSYTIEKVLLTTRWAKLIRKKKFAAATLDPKQKTFILHVTTFSIDSGDEVHLSKRAKIAHLKADKAPAKVFSKYINFVDVFLPKLAAKLPEHTGINDHIIVLVVDWQPDYSSIYSLGLVELEILKIYIKNNLANSFITTRVLTI